ncbi:MlaD family protein [Conexibacter sp. SYSU D00693]|uniref:MlaD family protein n=1 Tax=Conexibacter sp. SYSU D00693 TaxID=2812560 RepID=UPI00196A54A7|nr:MlaD family protein [Conexibacter sp. SYSU D00693]
MTAGGRQHAAALLRFVALAAAGVAALSYLFVMQRGPVPLRDTYEVKAQFTDANGVVGGLGQPVNVAGVKVGAVTRSEVDEAGNAVVTMAIERDELPRVHDDARATLEPITPLKDMQVELSPGTASRPALRDGAVIGEGSTTSPAELSTLLSALDGDTRAYLQTLLRSLQVGTRDRALNLRLMFRALGPTARQAGELADAVAGRRRELARLVSNLARVTRAASDDRQLARLVQAGDRTLSAVAEQDRALGATLDELPSTLQVTLSSLDHTAAFARRLAPTTRALTPSLRALPAALSPATSFGAATSRALRTQVRPFVREAQPLVRDLTPAATKLAEQAQPLTTVTRMTNYILNELAYNPPGNDEGNLFWLAYFFHNFGSAFTLGDAHGPIGSAMALVSCSQLTASAPGQLIGLLTGAASACREPEGGG